MKKITGTLDTINIYFAPLLFSLYIPFFLFVPYLSQKQAWTCVFITIIGLILYVKFVTLALVDEAFVSDNEFIFTKKYFRKTTTRVRVPFSDIKNVSYETFPFKRISIYTQHNTAFGNEISYIPKRKWRLPYTKNKDVETLIDNISMARNTFLTEQPHTLLKKQKVTPQDFPIKLTTTPKLPKTLSLLLNTLAGIFIMLALQSFVFYAMTNPKEGLAVLIFLIVMALYFLSLFRLFKNQIEEAYDDNEAFIFRKKRFRKPMLEIRVPFSDVRNINYGFLAPTMTVCTRHDTALGKTISYVPKPNIHLNPFARKKSLRALVDRIDQARANH